MHIGAVNIVHSTFISEFSGEMQKFEVMPKAASWR
jgi:hypothetical protein